MTSETDLDDFLQKWRAAWPEWPLAQVFLPEAQRAVAEAWLALQLEWVEAAWGGEDPTPGFAKLAWWQDELRGWQKGARRHPLGRVLQRAPAPWGRLADALDALRAARAQVLRGEFDAAAAALSPAAAGIAACEPALFAAEQVDVSAPPAEVAHADAAAASGPALVCWALIAQHRLWHGVGELPADVRRVRADLLAAWPGARGGSRAGRVHAALVRARLQRLTAGTVAAAPVPPLRALWVAWRAARG